VRPLLTGFCFLGLLGACATSHPDHFYILSVQPQGAIEARTAPAAQVSLRVTLPSLVDRSEMTLNTSTNGVVVLEHERWAAPLADLAAQTLARDLELRRSDLLVTTQGADRAGAAVVKMTVDLVQISIRRGEQASVEAHWRISDPRNGGDVVGSGVFSAPVAQDGDAAVPQALSACLGLLADRLGQQMR